MADKWGFDGGRGTGAGATRDDAIKRIAEALEESGWSFNEQSRTWSDNLSCGMSMLAAIYLALRDGAQARKRQAVVTG